MEQTKVGWTAAMVEAHNRKVAKKLPPLPPLVTAVSLLAQITPSTDEQKLNKTERAYLAYLRALQPQWIGIQNITLKLANDCRLTPDFVTVDDGIVFTDVKGFQREDALIKMKVAARQFRWAKFVIVKKTKSGWEHAEVKP